MQERIGRFFNVRKGKSLHVTYLLFHYFFQGIGLSLLFAVASALFLSHFTVEELPKVFISSAICILVLGKLSEIVGRSWSTPKTLKATTIFITVTVFVIYLATISLELAWIPFVLYMWYQVIESQIDTEFWGLSSIIFDVRQAKRLYGLISVGDVPAKLVGSLSVALLAPLIGLTNLILLATISFIVGALLLSKILSNIKPHQGPGDSGEEEGDSKQHLIHKPVDNDAHRQTEAKSKNILIRFFKTELVLALSMLYLVGAITLTFTEFSFLAGVEHKFHSEIELANFFALIGTIANSIIIVCKLFLSGKAIERLGVRRSLAILPLFIILACIAVAVTGKFIITETPLLWLFAAMVIFAAVFKAVLYQPLFLALFQPLPAHIRHHAHSIVNDFISPLGLFISGVALYIGISIYEGINLYKIDYVLLTLSIIWFVLVFFTAGKYMIALRSAINKRLIDSRQLNLGDEKSLNILRAKLKSPRPDEVIYTAEMISKTDEGLFKVVVLQLLKHEVPEVRLYAIRKIIELKLKTDSEELYEIIISDESINVREQAVKLYCSLYEDIVDRITPMLDYPELAVKSAALKGFLKSGDLEAMIIGGQQLLIMLQSEGDELIAAINIVGSLAFRNYYKPLLELLLHENIEVKRAAITACGKIGNTNLINHLIPFLDDKSLKKITIESLGRFGEPIFEYIKDSEFGGKYVEEAIKLCSRIGGENAAGIIFSDYFKNAKAEILDEALKALNRLNFEIKLYKILLESKLNEELELGFTYLRMLSFLESEETSGPIYNALNEGFKNLKNRLFLLLALLYDRNTISKAKTASLSPQREMRANALEYLDNVIDRELKLRLFPLIEDITIEEKTGLLERFYPHHNPLSQDIIIANILNLENSSFLIWTKAIVIYNHYNSIEHDTLEYYKNSNNKLLKECANYAIVNKGIASKISTVKTHHPMKTKIHHPHESMLEIEKVLILKSTNMFAATPENILVGIAGISIEEKVQKGEDIFKKDDLGNCLYVICDGDISIHIDGKQLSVLHNRDIFGELALLDPEPRSATATAIDDCLLLRIDQAAFNELIEDRPEVAQGILTILSKRIRGQNEVIRELQAKQNN